MLSLLAVACPPLAVLATAGRSLAAANLAMTLLGYFPGMIQARHAVERHAVAVRYERVARLLDN